jgi:hypothetical protein
MFVRCKHLEATEVDLHLRDLPVDLDFRTEMVLRKAYVLFGHQLAQFWRGNLPASHLTHARWMLTVLRLLVTLDASRFAPPAALTLKGDSFCELMDEPPTNCVR